MMLMLCYKCKSWGPHTYMYVMCITILSYYIMLVGCLPLIFIFVMISCDPFFICGVQQHVMYCARPSQI